MKKQSVTKGVALLIALAFVIVLGIGVAAIVKLHSTQVSIVRCQSNSTRAFYSAEAGLQRTLYDLDQDFEKDTDPSWTDGDINGVDVTQGGTITIPQNRDDAKRIDSPDQPFYFYISDSLSNGSYSISLLNISGKTDEIWVKSTGVWKDSTGTIVAQRTIVARVTENNVSPWNTAIFGGTGLGGVLINGNVDIHGSVIVLGNGLTPGDYAIDLSGTASISNNYSGIPAGLLSLIPPCPTDTFNGEMVETLEAMLRVRHGLVGLSGNAVVGRADVSGNGCKETLDGVYVTDGYGGTKGDSSVYSDNGTANAYDLGDSITFPSLSGPYTDPDTGIAYSTYLGYLKANALVISDAAKLDQLADITPVSSFNYSAGANTISADGNGNLTISGIIYIEGGDLEIKESPGEDTINYSGSGIIVAEGDGDLSDGEVRIDISLLSADTFPTIDVLGLITPGKIEFDEASINVAGAFYAEREVSVKKQTTIAGTIVSNYVNMGLQVPGIFQVPALANNLPKGMIDLPDKWFIITKDWQEI